MAPQKVPMLSVKCWHSQTVVIKNCGSAFFHQLGTELAYQSVIGILSCVADIPATKYGPEPCFFSSSSRISKDGILILHILQSECSSVTLSDVIASPISRSVPPQKLVSSTDLGREFICLCCLPLLQRAIFACDFIFSIKRHIWIALLKGFLKHRRRGDGPVTARLLYAGSWLYDALAGLHELGSDWTDLMWQRKGRSSEEGRRPHLNCSLLLQKRINTVLRDSKTKRRPPKPAWNAVILCPGLLLMLCSGKLQKSQSHLSFSHRASHSVVPLPWNWGEHSGGNIPLQW